LKKTVSILLLLMLVFNWCGYRWVISFMETACNNQLEVKLDNNDYNEHELIELRVPLSLPYQTAWLNFERVNGEIEVNGIHYKYVKRKVENGEVILKCIPNHNKQKLQSAREQFYQLAYDMQQNKTDKKPASQNIIKSITGDVEVNYNYWHFAKLILITPAIFNSNQQLVSYNFLHNIMHPPEA
jgi:hypothetical protein